MREINYQPLRRSQSTKTISVTSGKGGVGKTTLITNLAKQLAQMGQKVLILDGDLGMANVDIMFGCKSKSNLLDVIEGEKTLDEIVTKVSPQIDLISGGSGIYELQSLTTMQKWILMDQVAQLDGAYDYVLIDTAPGIDDNVLYLNAASGEVIIVVTPDPTSMTDAYALMKVMNQRYKHTQFSVFCNMVQDDMEALQIFKRLSDVATEYLCVSLNYRGYIPVDLNLRKATKQGQLVVESSPRSPSVFALKNLCENLVAYQSPREANGGVQLFWQQLVGVA